MQKKWNEYTSPQSSKTIIQHILNWLKESLPLLLSVSWLAFGGLYGPTMDTKAAKEKR